MAEPIEIIIRKGTGGSGTGFGISGANVSDDAINRGKGFGEEGQDLFKKGLSDKALMAASGLAIAATKKGINYAISQYGNMTGNYITQSGMELGMEFVNNLLSIGGAAIAGSKFGVAGAAVGAGIAVVNMGIGYGFQYNALQTNIAKLNTYANIMQDRSGNTLNNGSRGTDY